jgi:hypothetical protein
MKLHAVAVEFYYTQPAVALLRAGLQDRERGFDEGGFTQHGALHRAGADKLHAIATEAGWLVIAIGRMDLHIWMAVPVSRRRCCPRGCCDRLVSEGGLLLKTSSISSSGELAKITEANRFSFQRWTLRTRLAVLVLALAVPLNLLILGAILQLARSADEAQRRTLLYTARAIAGSVDVLVSKNISLGQALANSPALLRDDLPAFRAEALRAFPPATSDARLLVADLEGRQIFNTAQKSGQTLPPRNPRAVALQRRALETRSVIVTERIVFGPLTQSWVATIEIPVFKMDNLFVSSPSR